MASALQKLFRKRISKQQLQEQRQKQQEAEAAKAAPPTSRTLPRSETQPYLTVSSLNSPSSSTLHFPYSSKLSLASFTAQVNEDGSYSTSPPPSDHTISREERSSKSHPATRPRAASLSAHSMLREFSDSSQGWRTSQHPDGGTHLNQFGSQLTSVAVAPSQRTQEDKDDEEDEELDTNPIYVALTQKKTLQYDWNIAKLVLVPSKLQSIGVQEMNSEAFVAMHAFQPSNLFKDQYVSTRSTTSQRTDNAKQNDDWSGLVVNATLEAESRSVNLVVTRPAGGSFRLERTLNVLGETTVYRSMSSQEATLISPSTSSISGQRRGRKERIRIRVLTIDGLIIPSEALARERQTEFGSLTRSDSGQSFQMRVDNYRKPNREESIKFPQGSPILDVEGTETRLPLLPEAVKNDDHYPIPLRRQFLADFAFLLDPPTELHLLRPPLRAAFETLVRAANEFTCAYVYVSGFDAYNVSRIRRGILSKAWQSFEACRESNDLPPMSLLNSEGRARLLLLLENVVMGYCHGKIYSSIRAVYRTADETVDNVINTYQELQISMEDLGVGVPAICKRPALLDRAIFIARHLGDAEEDMEYLLSGSDVGLIRSLAKQGELVEGNIVDSGSIYYTAEKNRGRIRTPLDVFDVLRATLEEIGSALEKAQKLLLDKKGTIQGSLGLDELLPILAYVIIRAGPMKFASVLYYARQFGLSDAVSSQANWALVTHDAVLEYLRKDPLQLCSARSPMSTTTAISPYSLSASIHSPISRDGLQMERKSSTEGWHRERRSSLPSSILLSSIHSELSDSTNNSSKVHSNTNSEVPSSATLLDLSEEANTTERGFKVPGRPASAYTGFTRARVMSALDVVGEDALAVSDSSPRTFHSSRPASSLSRRTTSMSGNGELLIRPQIVVRSKKSQTRSPATSSSSQERPMLPKDYDSKQSLDRTLSLGSKMMNRAGSEESPNRRLINRTGEGRGASAVQVPQHARRKSLDSWTAFSFFGGGSLLSTPEASGGTTAVTEMSPSSSSQGYPSMPGLPSPPSTWLSSWTSDWGQKRKDPTYSTINRLDNDAGSSPASVTSNEGAVTSTSLGSWAFPRSTSSNSNLALGLGGSLRYHDSDNTISDITTTSSSWLATKKAPSIRSNSSSSQSHQQHPHHHQQQTRSDDLHVPERRHKSSRTRLLSISTPAEPLPPRVYPESATGDYFQAQHSYHFSNSSSSYSPLDAKQRLHFELNSSTDQLTPRSFHQTLDSPASSTYFPLPPSIGRIQIPTPVDELSDPMSRVKAS